VNHYQSAICRSPSANSAQGLTSVDLGAPDPVLLLKQHDQYISTLGNLGVEVTLLDALEDYPDSYFTEDVAIVTPEIAVITRPGAVQRRGETKYIQNALETFRAVKSIDEPGTLDGGDVLVVNKHCVVGLSERTNHDGASQLGEILGEFGYHTDIVNVPEALHFKSSVNFIDENTLLVTQACYPMDCIADYRKLVVPEGEEYAANVVWMNDVILMPEGYPGTRRLLEENGYQIREMAVSEISKMDGGLTCLSLRLT
jgi:dimethylargininase